MSFLWRKCVDFYEIDLEGIKYRDYLRTISAVILFLALVEFSLGLFVFTYLKNVHWGSWWAAVFLMSVCVFSLSSANKNVVFASIVLSIISLCWVGSAVIVDGIGWTQFNMLTGCYNTDTQEGSGSTDCITSYDDGNTIPQCVCDDGTFCHAYTLSHGDDCSSIRTTYVHSLASSFAFLVVLTVLLGILAILSCMSICCEPPEPEYEQPVGHFPRIEMSTMIVDSPMIPMEDLDGTEVEVIIDSVY